MLVLIELYLIMVHVYKLSPYVAVVNFKSSISKGVTDPTPT